MLPHDAFYSRGIGYSRVPERFATISTRSGSLSPFINIVDPFRNDSIRGRGDDLTGGTKFARFRKLSLSAINHDEI